MSIITAIFQAIGQALTFILPISESGHSAIFHDFSARFSDAGSELTGLVHIGIALGITAAFYKVFLRLIYEFINGWKDLFSKQFDLKKAKNSRRFMYLTFVPYFFMLLYFIPAGESGNVFQFLKCRSFDGNLISEGICFLITAGILFAASNIVEKNEKGMQLSLPVALILSLAIFFTVPLAGLSLSAVIIGLGIICNVNKNAALRYFISLSVPILIVGGIIEIAASVTYVTILVGVIGVAVAAVFSFLAIRLLHWIIRNSYIKYFSYYNLAIGTVILITGIIEYFVR